MTDTFTLTIPAAPGWILFRSIFGDDGFPAEIERKPVGAFEFYFEDVEFVCVQELPAIIADDLKVFRNATRVLPIPQGEDEAACEDPQYYWAIRWKNGDIIDSLFDDIGTEEELLPRWLAHEESVR